MVGFAVQLEALVEENTEIVMRFDMIEKNLELQYHLMMEMLRDPGALHVPEDAEAIFLPEDDESLRQANLRLGKRREKLGKRVVYVRVKLVPETRSVMIPNMTVTSNS